MSTSMKWHCQDCHQNFSGPKDKMPTYGCAHCGSKNIFDCNAEPIPGDCKALLDEMCKYAYDAAKAGKIKIPGASNVWSVTFTVGKTVIIDAMRVALLRQYPSGMNEIASLN